MGLEVIMREGFAVSYGLLCGLFVMQGLLLHEALRRAAKLSRLYSEAEERKKREALANPPWYLPAGIRLPEFASPVLGTDRILTQADLLGRETILLFVSPADAASVARHRTYHQIGPAFGSMWEAVEGEVYLVCKENRQDCQRFVGSVTKAIWDEDGLLFNSFFIDKTPRAVRLDEEGTVIRYGEPDEVRDTPPSAFNGLHDETSSGEPTDGGLAGALDVDRRAIRKVAHAGQNGDGRG
ncbi:MAG: hypothetical protein C5B54_10370 [Acidobacteria bacterium]|nr:MAG: hypothetical protein C5B54_10370 [Acidobacteriota bacterium]